MNKHRLLKLADLLEADAANKKGLKFDLGTWGRSYDDRIPATVSCGSTACAMGLAVLSGAFKNAGLVNRYGADSAFIVPQIGEAKGFDAAAVLFAIDRESADFLFSDDRYPQSKITGAAGERYVAKRIRDFVAGKVSAANSDAR